MAGKRKRSILVFPLAGLSENFGFGQQPQGTTVDCQNVRVFDPATGRARGAQRNGLSKYMPDQIAASEVQDICHVVYGAGGS